jgi:hypothetical protein
MNRRQAAGRLVAAAALVMLLGGHTPYGQWVVYRKKHLVIGCHREDPATYELANRRSIFWRCTCPRHKRG